MLKIIKSHFKSEYIMQYQADSDYRENNFNELIFKEINDKNKHEFEKQDFIHPSIFCKGRYFGAYKDGNAVGFISVVLRGEKGGFFTVKNSDMCLQKVFVFPEYRGKGIAKDMISYCIKKYIPRNSGGIVSICVMKENYPAISCYKKLGFKTVKKQNFIRIIRDFSFPRFYV